MGGKLPNLAQPCPTYPKVAQPQSKIYNFDIQMILCKKNEDFIVKIFLDYCQNDIFSYISKNELKSHL